jgi:glutamate/tyrosine decarboxylase-like PLP-dependent enzyme
VTAIVGIGRDNVIPVPVDLDARMDVAQLEQMLNDCLSQNIPVYTVVAIMGSTEQGAIDPLDDIINLRDQFQQKGLSFVIHADGAWGGYFASMLQQKSPVVTGPNDPVDFVPEAPLSPYVTKQILAYARADSITIDPHK